MGRSAAAGLAVLALGWLLTLEVGPWADERVTDLILYRSWSGSMLDGSLPYRDLSFEYPPLAAPVIALPGLLGTGEGAYRLAFAAETFLLAGGVLLLTGHLAARTGGDVRRAMVAVGAAPVLCGAIIRTHFDLAPVALTLGALALLCAGRVRTALGALGLAAMTKGFPLVVAPVALVWLRARGGARAAVQGALALFLVIAAVGAAALAVSPGGTVDAVRYQAERPAQLESAPALVLLALDRLGLGEARVRLSHGSDAVLHPAGDAVTAAFGAALVATLLLVTAAARADPPDERRMVLASLSAVTALAALGKVLSPQFLIWVIPLAALAFAWRMHALAAASAAAIALTLVEFPSHYWDLVALEPFPLAVVALRNVALLGALALALRALVGPHRRLGAPAAAPAAGGPSVPARRLVDLLPIPAPCRGTRRGHSAGRRS